MIIENVAIKKADKTACNLCLANREIIIEGATNHEKLKATQLTLAHSEKELAQSEKEPKDHAKTKMRTCSSTILNSNEIKQKKVRNDIR